MNISTSLGTCYYPLTGDHLDFFPHAEGYVNVLDFSEFHYIYTYKDHTSAPLSTGLGNMRLKYTKDPGSNQTEILEENHYYPYGMTHKGYNASHLIFWQMPGIGIDLVEVTPLMGDKYKYGFGGMEYQEELALNHYDFGARNGVYPERSRGNPALGRWMNIDPLAEMMRRHSPYNYAFNNPVFFIDPDGMMSLPFGGSNTGSFESYGGSGGGFDVRTYDENGKTLDFVTVNNKQGVDITADGEITKNNRQTPGDMVGNSAGDNVIGIYGLGGEKSGDGTTLKNLVQGKGGKMYTVDEWTKIMKHIDKAWNNGKGKPIDMYGYSRGGNQAVRIANARPDVLFNKLVLFDPHILADGYSHILTGENVREVHNYYQNNPRTGGILLPIGDNPYLGSPIRREYAPVYSPGVNVNNNDLTGNNYPVNHLNIIWYVTKKLKIQF